MNKIFLTIVFLLCPFLANATDWQLLQSDSAIHFSSWQENQAVTGYFSNFSSQLRFDETNLNHAAIIISVDTASVVTAYQPINALLTPSPWLNAQIFPEAIFESTPKSFKKINQHNYQLTGTLYISNVAAPITAYLTVEKLSEKQLVVKGHTLIKRSQFGVEKGAWGSTGTSKDDVKVEFNLLYHS